MQESIYSDGTVPFQQRDKRRHFTPQQRLAIYVAADARCANCGVEIDWFSWNADHIVNWARGGRTELSNGRAICVPCHKAEKWMGTYGRWPRTCDCPRERCHRHCRNNVWDHSVASA